MTWISSGLLLNSERGKYYKLAFVRCFMKLRSISDYRNVGMATDRCIRHFVMQEVSSLNIT